MAEIAHPRDVVKTGIIALFERWQTIDESSRWKAFAGRWLEPVLSDSPPTPYAELATLFEPPSAESVCTYLRMIRSEFAESLLGAGVTAAERRDRISEIVATLREIEGPPTVTIAPRAWSAESLEAALSAANGDQLARLVEGDGCDWSEADFSLMWRHQLELPVLGEIDLSKDLMQQTYSPLAEGDPADWSIGELLHHGCPPVPWLVGVQQCARGKAREGVLPRSIASAIFLAAVSAAIVRRETRITRSSDEVILLGIDTCLGYPWIDDRTRRLLADSKSKLRTNDVDT